MKKYVKAWTVNTNETEQTDSQDANYARTKPVDSTNIIGAEKIGATLLIKLNENGNTITTRIVNYENENKCEEMFEIVNIIIDAKNRNKLDEVNDMRKNIINCCFEMPEESGTPLLDADSNPINIINVRHMERENSLITLMRTSDGNRMVEDEKIFLMYETENDAEQAFNEIGSSRLRVVDSIIRSGVAIKKCVTIGSQRLEAHTLIITQALRIFSLHGGSLTLVGNLIGDVRLEDDSRIVNVDGLRLGFEDEEDACEAYDTILEVRELLGS